MPWLSSDFDLLAGQPAELRRAAAAVRAMVEHLDGTARTLASPTIVDPVSWMGRAADRWSDRVTQLPGRIDRAGEHLAAAAAALDRFADHLDEAQAQVARARSQVSAIPHDPPDAATSGEHARLIRQANSARHDAATANADARHAFDAVTEGARFAPRREGGGLLGHLGRAVANTTETIGGQMTSFGKGVYDGTVGTAVSITDLGIDAARFAVAHPGVAASGAWGVLSRPDRVIAKVWDNKGELLAAAVNLETLENDPARWLGQLAPTLLLGATGGGAAARLQEAARSSSKVGPMIRGAQTITGLSIAAEAPATVASATWTVAGNLARSETRNADLVRTMLDPEASAPPSPLGDPPTPLCPEPSADPAGGEPVAP